MATGKLVLQISSIEQKCGAFSASAGIVAGVKPDFLSDDKTEAANYKSRQDFRPPVVEAKVLVEVPSLKDPSHFYVVLPHGNVDFSAVRHFLCPVAVSEFFDSGQMIVFIRIHLQLLLAIALTFVFAAAFVF